MSLDENVTSEGDGGGLVGTGTPRSRITIEGDELSDLSKQAVVVPDVPPAYSGPVVDESDLGVYTDYLTNLCSLAGVG